MTALKLSAKGSPMALAITLTVAFVIFMIMLGVAVHHFTSENGFYGF